MGRLIAVFCCVIGIFICSLIVVAMMHVTLLDAEEENAYKKIDIIYTKAQSNNFITNYFNTYIKYKMWRFRKQKEIKDYFIKRNRYNIEKEAHLLKIKASLEKPFGVDEFCESFRENWNNEANDNKFNTAVNCYNITDSLDPLISKAQTTHTLAKTSKNLSFQMFNLSRLIFTLGGRFEIPRIIEYFITN